MEDGFHVCACVQCGQRIEFPAEGLGMGVACPNCGIETTLCGETSGGSEVHETITAAELQSALTGSTPRRRVSVFYQFGLLLEAFLMLLLPLVYLGFVALAAYAVYWYAIHGLALFTSYAGGIHVLLLKIVFYIGPLMGGAIAVFFMFKPILARSPGMAEPLELNPAQHPRLYQFIAHVSDVLRVSMPKRIFLDCELNASAGLRRGWMSFLSNDLVLNLGMPVVAGLNTRQFAALVGHELGHCSQWLALRLAYIIQRINRWFFRVVYQRDTWDEALDEWSNSVEDWRFSLMMACVRLAVGFSRRILWVLMLIGHAATCFLSRQMEYHADVCAMGIAGSEALETLLLRLREMAVVTQIGERDLAQIWQKRRQLPDSLPDFFEKIEQDLPPRFREEAQATLLNETAGAFATHPTPAQRIRKARQRSEPGIFHLERPAHALFGDFKATARTVTIRHYRENLRLPVTNAMLKQVREFFPNDSKTPLVPTDAVAETGPIRVSTLRVRRSADAD